MSAQDTPAWNIRKWLLQHPKPSKVKVHFGDGREPQTLRIQGRSWAKSGETIAALGAELIEAYDEAGELIRATRPEQELQRSEAAEIPEGLAADSNALLVTHVANLIHRAYEHSTEVAFTKLVDICDRMNERSENAERRLERIEASNRSLQQERIEDQEARLEELLEATSLNAQANGVHDPAAQQALMFQMFQAFMGGKMRAGMAGAPAPAAGSNGAANGKGS